VTDLITQAYEQLIERFTRWADSEENIRAVLVIGSRARSNQPADQWSDLDLAIITDDPGAIINNADWVQNVGIPWLTFIEPTGDKRGLERRVLFEGGLDVDFSPLPTVLVKEYVEHGLSPEANDTLRRGARVLIDKDKLAQRILAMVQDTSPSSFPSQSDFLQVVNDFWYHTVWTAKHLRRGELWWAKSGSDDRLKSLLRIMMEWHAQSQHKGEIDTWMRGRFLEEWVDQRALEELKSAFAHYDLEDIWHALFVTMNLFRWLTVETAQNLELSYPVYGDEKATELVNQLFSGKP
jgi:aminoglycoside 6-adenylyltransferase